MYKFLAKRIKDGFIAISDVPKKHRKKVLEELELLEKNEEN